MNNFQEISAVCQTANETHIITALPVLRIPSTPTRQEFLSRSPGKFRDGKAC